MPDQPTVKTRRKITKRTDFRFRVPARPDRKHGWSQHAKSKSFFYQVLRRFEILAALNDGFIHEGTATTASKVHHYRKEDAPVRQVVQRIKAFLREKGIIGEEVSGTNRFGHSVRGFYLAKHGACCRTIDGFHVFFSEYNEEVRRLRFTSWSQNSATTSVPQSSIEVAPKLQQSCTEVAVKLHLPQFEVAPGVATEVAPEHPEVSAVKPDTESVRGIGIWPGMWFGSQESLESCQSDESVESLESRSLGYFGSAAGTEEDQSQSQRQPQHLFSDLTMTVTQDLPDKETRNEIRTVGEYFHIDGMEVEDMLSVLSAGRFDPKYLDLEKYAHKNELKWACLYAVDWLFGQPYAGLKSHADILGRAMDELKEKGINAPKYFPKLLRALRNGGPMYSSTAA